MIKNYYYYYLIKRSGLFDKDFYLTNYSDVERSKNDPIMHYIRYGWMEGRNPSAHFNTRYYLDKYSDVKEAKMNPLIHYIKYGRNEGRVSSPESIQENNRKKIPLELMPNVSKVNLKDQEDLTIFVHIGQTKTGSSIIQNFLDVNRPILLSEHGYLYPNFASGDLSTGRSHNHQPWFMKCSSNNVKFIDDLKFLDDFTRSHSIDKVILSCEAWEISNEAIAFFKRISKFNSRFNLRMIVYLRRIDSYIESAWKQWGLKKFDTIQDFMNHPFLKNRYRLTLEHLECWENLVGKQNMCVRAYEKQQLPKGLLYDFITSIGIDFTSTNWEKTENTNLATNMGYDQDVLQILHSCKDLFTDVHDNHLFVTFSELLGEKFQKAPFESYNLLSPNQRLELIEASRPYEKEIAQKYMGRTDGRIFYDPLPDTRAYWQPYEGLSLERVIPIFVKMIDEENRKLNSIIARIKALEE